MSIESWKEEFYPIPATSDMSELDAARHSLRKWEGLKKKNLEKHKVSFRSYILEDDDRYTFMFNCVTCALCKINMESDIDIPKCKNCPLAKVGECCMDEDSSYGRSKRNPTEMIKALKKALKYVEKKKECDI